MIKAVLFDMDGLIFDSESLYKRSWQFAASEQGLVISEDLYQNFIGVQDPECEQMLVEAFADQFDLQRFIQVRDQHFHNARAEGIPFKPGFAELFSAIQSKQLKTAIVTSAPRADVEHNFSRSDYLSQFDLVITAEDVKRGKPNPDCYQMAYQSLGLSAQQCLVLEDSNNGAHAGLAASCQVIMIPDLLPALPEYQDKVTLLSSLDQVIPCLDKLA
ncbi:HAD family hydrolase [Vibrio sp. WXL103]|uniref:HAD family hydrolase n=1 Tax=Vibrio sp. WXL103 TaxID=3450710 RepID=UPI003EC5A6EE